MALEQIGEHDTNIVRYRLGLVVWTLPTSQVQLSLAPDSAMDQGGVSGARRLMVRTMAMVMMGVLLAGHCKAQHTQQQRVRGRGRRQRQRQRRTELVCRPWKIPCFVR